MGNGKSLLNGRWEIGYVLRITYMRSLLSCTSYKLQIVLRYFVLRDPGSRTVNGKIVEVLRFALLKNLHHHVSIGVGILYIVLAVLLHSSGSLFLVPCSLFVVRSSFGL